MRIKPYILAGGKSSRMGRDKAMLELEGETLLARAVETLRSVKALQSQDGRVVVTICGEREDFEGADRAIVDRYPSCGPLGGIEAALNDLGTSDEAEWAFFIPIDMPLLSSDLIDRLLSIWGGVLSERACLVVVEEIPQPLVSLVHRSVLGPVREALDAGRYKVVPVLQSVGAACTSIDQGLPRQDRSEDGFGQSARDESAFSGYREQFINVNTEADLIRVATLLKHKGSNY